MRIMSINSAISQSSKANFKGLWGKENSECVSTSFYDSSQMCEMGTTEYVTTKTYYPFKNETTEDIAKIVRENSGIKHHKNDYDNDISDSIRENRVKVMPKLNITEEEYNKYRNDDLLSQAENILEDKLKLAGLKEYLNRNFRR